MPTLKNINAQAGTHFRRTSELVDAVRPRWHPQIHRPSAEADGLTPADFTWRDYPVTNVRLEMRDWDTQPVVYLADMPAHTPQVNAYYRPEERQPGCTYKGVRFGQETWYELLVTGSALSRVVFTLVDLADSKVVHEAATDLVNGLLEAGIATGTVTQERSLIWKRLVPGGSLQVRLDAVPLFFPYINPATGDGGNHYSNVNNGYLVGDVASSRVYTLAMDHNGNLSLS